VPNDDALLRLGAAHSAGRGLAILLDYDGTLVPIADHPRLATLPPDSRDLLASLASLPRVILGIVSGRPLDELRAMVGLAGLLYAGTNGAEREWNGMRLVPGESKASRALCENVTGELTRVLPLAPGAWLERKPAGLTLHYRQAEGNRADRLRQAALAKLAAFAGRIDVAQGPLAIEINLHPRFTKGGIVDWVCRQVAPDHLPFFAGDAANDSDALAAVRKLRGVSVGVGPHAPGTAELSVESPAALVEILHRLWRLLRITANPNAPPPEDLA